MTITIHTQAEAEALIKDGVLKVDDDLIIKCDIKINADIDAHNIDGWNIEAHRIDGWDVKVNDLHVKNITVEHIDALNVNAHNINAFSGINAFIINANDIYTQNIKASNIDCKNINYFAFCIVYKSLKCKTILGRRENSIHKCLDQDIEYINNEEE